MAADYAIGVDLGGTFIKAGVVDSEGRVRGRTRRPTDVAGGRDAVVANIVRAAEEALAAVGAGWEAVCGLGIGSPGVFDFRAGTLLVAPNLACLNGARLAHLVKARLPRPTPVFLENDANCAAFGEHWAGAGGEAHSLVLFTLGTGIGGGIVLEGRIWHGARGVGAELGHQTLFPNGKYVCGCGNRGCLEAYASAPATVRRFVDAVLEGRPSALADRARKGEPLTSEDLYEAAVKGDALSRAILEETGTFLGIACTNMINILDPQMIVFSGGMTAAGDLLLRPILAEAERRTCGPKLAGVTIRFGALGNDAGLIGAAGCAFQRFGISA